MKDNMRKNFIWNIIGLSFNGLNAFLFLMIVKLINGTDAAGVFTYAYAICCLFYFLSTYYNRTYQVSDIKGEYTFNQYFSVRIFTSILSLIFLLVFSLINGFDSYKILMIMCIMLFRTIESISDVFYGLIQEKNYLYKVGLSITVKSIISISAFAVFDYFTKDVLLGMILVTIVNLIVLLFYDYRNFIKLSDSKLEFDFSKTKNMLITTFSVFIFSFLQTYLLNEQKYVLTYFADNDVQTIFGILIMPATVLSMVCNYLIFPFINKFSYFYSNNNIKEFRKLSRKINLVLSLFGLFATAVTYFIGIPILNFLFNIDINNYRGLLVIIVGASAIYAVSTVISNLLTIMRHNTSQSVLYLAISIFGTIVSYFLIANYGIYGATYSYLINFVLLLLIITIIYIFFIREVRK